MELETVRYEPDGENIVLITINQPDKLNALSVQVLSDLDAAFKQARSDSGIKGVVLT